jgi:competence protein ComEC
VLQDFVVEEVWASPLTKTTAAYKNFASAVKSEGLSMKNPSVGTVYTYEYLTLTVLYSGAGTTNANDSSLVVMLQYGSMKFLFTGDISDTIENKLVQSGVDLRCDVLKVAHHGSKYSSCSEFLEASAPSIAVIQVGKNLYGHPTPEALSRLKDCGASIYRNDRQGAVMLQFRKNGRIRVKTMKQAPLAD